MARAALNRCGKLLGFGEERRSALLLPDFLLGGETVLGCVVCNNTGNRRDLFGILQIALLEQQPADDGGRRNEDRGCPDHC
jgi:hypothetical protein